MNNYPILRVPSSIKSANSAIPPVPASLGLPPQKPGDKPKEIEWEAIFGNKLIVIVISILSLLMPVFLLLVIVGILFLVSQQIKDYPVRLQKWESQKKDFDYLQSEYQHQKAQYEQKKSEVLTQLQIEEYRKQQVIKALAQTLPHDGMGSKATRGWSEDIFKNHLNQYFSGRIHTGLTLARPGFEYPYSPDFAYIDKELNLYIDIEIDEPYVFHTGEPTHFQECQKDRQRNDFFLNKNWIIIRFAEEQVCKYPEECCKFVATVASKCGIPIPASLKNVATPPSVSHWTMVEAREMAAKKARDSYKSKSSYSADYN
jgi:hypothetical protein